jgi:hypothetical protein
VVNNPKNFKIPKEFTLFGHKYVVEVSENLFSDFDCYGTADEDLKKINIQSKKTLNRIIKDGKKEYHDNFEMTAESFVETYYHELMHIILDAMGEENLSKKESFVNMLGKALLEIYLSSKYEQNSKNKKYKRKNNGFRITKKQR